VKYISRIYTIAYILPRYVYRVKRFTNVNTTLT